MPRWSLPTVFWASRATGEPFALKLASTDACSPLIFAIMASHHTLMICLTMPCRMISVSTKFFHCLAKTLTSVVFRPFHGNAHTREASRFYWAQHGWESCNDCSLTQTWSFRKDCRWYLFSPCPVPNDFCCFNTAFLCFSGYCSCWLLCGHEKWGLFFSSFCDKRAQYQCPQHCSSLWVEEKAFL